ncbi:MAG: DUF2911 domain-containing protein [Lewinellaceae bacterium]|nr:DUF2911 domain-containing protein [Lewinella sp.]MCB9279576.1 DUF2911 domain-containing protein [Lewinellaceae bacterium]
MMRLINNLLPIALLVVFALPAHSQIRTPAASPGAELKQTVGLTDITLAYSRPSMKGRKIFSAEGVVPFGSVWRLGANSATKFTFSTDVKLGGQPLKAGSYAVLATPGASSWVFMFYPYESTNWTSYTEKDPVAKVTAQPQSLAPINIETLTFDIGDITNTSANIGIMWESTWVALPLEVPVDEAVMASIKSTLAGPTPNDYYAAASYYHAAGKDLNQALEWIQKATNVEKPAFWQVRTEALILADLGKKKEAIAAAKKSLELAKAAGNDDYVRMNEKSIKEWAM